MYLQSAVSKVGGKNASLGEMIRQLQPKGVKVPTGFATTADAKLTKIFAEYGTDTDVAVRSSATAEDLPDASFAGQARYSHYNLFRFLDSE